MSATALALIAAALAIGVTGAWSPCGFSMVDTLGPAGYARGRGRSWLAAITFAAGALAGGVLTFGSLALLGSLLPGDGGRAAYLVGAAIALAAALAELRGTRIAPQIRRQVPEHWRRVLPLPLAAGLYGVLLGLGFTTFVLSFGVWALAGISVAAGDPELGLLIGLAFGAGRALPVVVLAPVSNRPFGLRAAELMMDKPILLRGLRFGDGLALLAVAGVLAGAAPTQAAGPEPERPAATPEAFAAAARGSDPSVSGGALAWERRSGVSSLRRRGRTVTFSGSDPALGAGLLAFRRGGSVLVVRLDRFEPVAVVPAPGADALAVSGRWLVYRSRSTRGDRLIARRLSRPRVPRRVARTRGSRRLSRPSLSGGRVLYAVNGRGGSRIVLRRLGGGRRTLLRSRRALLTNPSLGKRAFVYVRTTRNRQQLRLRRLRGRGRGRVVRSTAATSLRDRGYESGHAPHRYHRTYLKRGRRVLWTTALGRRSVFFTRLAFRGGRPVASIVRVRR